MRTDSIDVSSLVSYINDIKPYHTKLNDVIVEYQANDDVFVGIQDDSFIDMELSSVWTLDTISDGTKKSYRIPAAAFPRHSAEIHQCYRDAISDAIPGQPASYRVPSNSGATVYVNGVERPEGVEYSFNDDRTILTFLSPFIPSLGDTICIDWFTPDRIFIEINGVWQTYELQLAADEYGYDLLAFDDSLYGTGSTFIPNSTNGILYNTDQVEMNYTFTDLSNFAVIGRMRVKTDENGRDYYVFEFDEALEANTLLKIRVEQRETYNGWTQTSIAESVKIIDLFRFTDAVNVAIADPGTWDINPDLFAINISSLTHNRVYDLFNFDEEIFDSLPISYGKGYYDLFDYDLVSYDELAPEYIAGYYNLFTISENLDESILVSATDSYTDRHNVIGADVIAAHLVESYKDAIRFLPVDLLGAHVTDLYSREMDIEIAPNRGSSETSSASIIDIASFKAIDFSFYDVESFDTLGYDQFTVINAVSAYSPDANNMVYVNDPANKIEIIHNYGYNPIIVAYYNGSMILPEAVAYPQVGVVNVFFSSPIGVVIHLA